MLIHVFPPSLPIRPKSLCCYPAFQASMALHGIKSDRGILIYLATVMTWDQYYKTFCNRNLQIFITSQSICPWQAFTTWALARGLL